MPSPILLAVLIATVAPSADPKSAPDYQANVAPILNKYCGGCHNDEDREGKFSVETHASIQRGTEHGPALLPAIPRGVCSSGSSPAPRNR